MKRTLDAVNDYMGNTGYHQKLELETREDMVHVVLATEFPTMRSSLFSSTNQDDILVFLTGVLAGFNLIGY